jgi:hypothetical protein
MSVKASLTPPLPLPERTEPPFGALVALWTSSPADPAAEEVPEPA